MVFMNLIKADNVEEFSNFVSYNGGPTVCIPQHLLTFGNPLMAAVSTRATKVTSLLLEMGADPNAQFTKGDGVVCTPFQVLIERLDSSGQVSQDAVPTLRKMMGAGADPLGKWPDVQCGLATKANVSAFFQSGTSNIQAALVLRADVFCATLLDCITDRDSAAILHAINERVSYWYPSRDQVFGGNMTVGLGRALHSQKVETCRRLVVDYSVDVNTVHVDNLTPLQYAHGLTRFCPDISTLLVKAGANPRTPHPTVKLNVFSMCLRAEEIWRMQPESNANVARVASVRNLISCMKQYTRFRVSLRLLHTGHRCSTSMFSGLSEETMLLLIPQLAPEGNTLNPEMIISLYKRKCV
jgi:hypothetical protein